MQGLQLARKTADGLRGVLGPIWGRQGALRRSRWRHPLAFCGVPNGGIRRPILFARHRVLVVDYASPTRT